MRHKSLFFFAALVLILILAVNAFAEQLMTVAVEKPLAFITIVDNSGSMTWSNRDPNNIRFKGIEFAIGRLKNGEAFSCVSFDTMADIVVPLTTVDEKNRRELAVGASMIPGDRNWTNYGEGFNKGLQVAIEAKEKGFFPVVVFLTDGELNVSASDIEDQRALERLVKNIVPLFLKEGIPIFTIGLGEFKKEILINIADAAKFYENSDQFFEVTDGSEIPFVMNSILSVIRGEKQYQSYSISSGKTETVFEIGPNVRKMAIELTALDQSIDVEIFDPVGNRINLLPERSFAFLKWSIDNPAAGKWRILIDSSTPAKVDISLKQEYDVDLIVDQYMGIGSTMEAVVKITWSDLRPVVIGEKLTIGDKEYEVKEIKGFLTVQGAGINTNAPLRWNGANLVGTIPKAPRTGVVQLFGEIQIECQDKKENATIKLAIPKKTVRVINAKIVKLDLSQNRNVVRNGEATIIARGENISLDSVEVQVIFPDGNIERLSFKKDAGSVFRVSFIPPLEGKYMIYPVPTEEFVFSSSSREIVVLRPYIKLKNLELAVKGAFAKRDYWIETTMITEYYSPDSPTVTTIVQDNEKLNILVPDIVHIKPGKTETQLRVMIEVEKRFSSLDKILRKSEEGYVTIRDAENILEPADLILRIRIVAPLPAVEVAALSAVIAFLSMIPALARKRKEIAAGRSLRLDPTDETVFGKSSGVRYRFENSSFPLRAFTISYVPSDMEEFSFSRGGDWRLKSEDVSGSIYLDEYPVYVGESVRLNDGSRITVKKGRKAIFAFSFENVESDQAVLKVRSTKYRVNRAAVVSSVFAFVGLISLVWWTIVQRFGI